MNSKYNELIYRACDNHRVEIEQILLQLDDDKYDDIVRKLEGEKEEEYRTLCKTLKGMRFRLLPDTMKQDNPNQEDQNVKTFQHFTNMIRFYEWMKGLNPDRLPEIIEKGNSLGLTEPITKALYIASCIDVDDMRKQTADNSISLGF